MESFDQWLATAHKTEASAGVVVIRGDGVYANEQEGNKKSVWDTIFGGRNSNDGDKDSGPRRSAPRSVVAPEEVELANSPTRGISVVSSMTYTTFDNQTAGDIESTATTPSTATKRKLRLPSSTKRKTVGHARKVPTTTAPSYMLAASSRISSLTTGRPERPKLKLMSKGTEDDDSVASFGSVSTADSLGQRVISPPILRQKKPRGPTKLTTAQLAAQQLADAAKAAENFSLLSFIGQGSATNNNRQAASNSDAMSGTNNKSTTTSLTENLVSDDKGTDIPSKVPATDGLISTLRQMACTSSFGYAFMFFGMASALLYGVLSDSRLSYSLSDVDISIDWDEELNVAFVGNSYLFINDIPRVMEAISEYHIHQESVIHSTGGSLGNLLLTGNGMYPRWKSDEAVLESYVNDYGNNVTIYDYGLCTIAQILEGYDEILSYGNEDEAYYNDGKNPCIRDKNYFNYIQNKLANSTFEWDYVVLVDQTKRMAIEEARQQSIYALTNAYGPLIEATGAIPVIVDTHAFWSDSTNMTGLVDIPTFQSLIYDGVLDYVEALASVLQDWQAPVIAPVGLAFLVVYEENYNLWQKLFIDDDIHSSVHGSYLFSCVLYATMYGHLPRRSTNAQIETLFSNSRLLVGQGIEYPTAREAFYYRRVAKRVALDGYIPTSMFRR